MESKWLICVASWLVTTNNQNQVDRDGFSTCWKFQCEHVKNSLRNVLSEDGEYPPSKLLGDLKSFLCLPLPKEII